MRGTLEILRQDQWLIVSFPSPQTVFSWAIYGGGKTKTQTVAWYQVKSRELNHSVNPHDFMREKLLKRGLPDAVGLLTSADLDGYADVEKNHEALSARCILTAGMSNALRVGDSQKEREGPIGTINLLCWLSAPMTERGYLEALSIAVEARTAAVLEGNIPSIQSGKPSTGTGTDCVVVAAPADSLKPAPVDYAGKHTLVGSLIGKTVFEATSRGIRSWKEKDTKKNKEEVLIA